MHRNGNGTCLQFFLCSAACGQINRIDVENGGNEHKCDQNDEDDVDQWSEIDLRFFNTIFKRELDLFAHSLVCGVESQQLRLKPERSLPYHGDIHAAFFK